METIRLTRRKKGKGLVNDFINTGILGELHFRGLDSGFKPYNFAGPGTNLQKRLNPDDSWKEWSKPINRADQIAYRHDLAYREFKDLPTRQHFDNIMIRELEALQQEPNIRWQERADAKAIELAMKTKRYFGMGKKKKKIQPRKLILL